MALFNEAFDKWVKEQIDARQKSLGFTLFGERDTNTDKRLQQQVTRTPFLRLASAVDVKDKGENSVYQKLIKAGFNENDLIGNTLARKCILQAGVIDSKSSYPSLDSLQKGLNNGNRFSGAYGWGIDVSGGNKENRGFVPMPGITRAKSTAHNNGALTATNINIRCYSKEQFALIDALYMRPGYTLLLEFGWSKYIDNDGNLKTIEEWATNPMSMLLNGQTDQFEINREIEKEREYYSGNYDAVYGKVNNFNWTFNPDGSYDIVIELTGMGDMIESLTINRGGTTSEEDLKENLENNNKPSVFRNRNKSILHKELYKIYSEIRTEIGKKQKRKRKIVENELFDYELKNFKSEQFTNLPYLAFLNSVLYSKFTTSNEGGTFNGEVYIKYGLLLAIIQSKIISASKNNKPTFVFDLDWIDEEILGKYENGELIGIKKLSQAEVAKTSLDKDENYILTIPGQLSTDPKVCLVPYSSFNVGKTPYPESGLNELLQQTNFNVDGNLYLGRLANVMVNMEHIVDLLETIPVDEENNIYLLDFLQNLNRNISSVLGGINKIDVKLNQDGSKIQFIENIPQNRQPKNNKYSKINVFGVQQKNLGGSFVRNIGLNATLGPKFANMAAIGSQVDGNQLGENAVSFSNYSLGLEDRVIGDKTIKKKKKNFGFIQDIADAYNADKDEISEKVKQLIPVYESIYVDGVYNINTIQNFTNNMTDVIKLALGKLSREGDEQEVNAPFFLPFNLSLDLDGISGMRLYEKFKITDHVLPPGYSEDEVNMQLMGISHTITPESWITKLESLSTKDFNTGERGIKTNTTPSIC